MSRNASGTYTLPLPPVVPGEVIEAAWANTTLDDIEQALTDSLDRFGRGGMAAAFKLFDGTVTAPGLAFQSEPGLGLYRPSAGVLGIAVGGEQVSNWSSNGLALAPTKSVYITKAPATATEATNKAYVDAAVGGVPVGNYLPLAGGTMTGLLVAGANLQLGLGGSLIYDSAGDIGFRHDTDGPYWSMESNGTFRAANGAIWAATDVIANGTIYPRADVAPNFYLAAVNGTTPTVNFAANCYIQSGGTEFAIISPSGNVVANKAFEGYHPNNRAIHGSVGAGYLSDGGAPGVRFYWGGIAERAMMMAGDGTIIWCNNGVQANQSMSLDLSSNLVAQGNVTAYSDERLKTDWQDIALPIDAIASLRTATYRRTDIDVVQAGVSAQELQRLLPECVVESNQGRLSVDYGRAALIMVANLAREIRRGAAV